MFINYVLIFLVGLLIGSFLNVCIFRIPKQKSIVLPPSNCPNCNNRINFYDLIPIVSYIFLKGRCRFCKSRISIQYPLIELLTGVMFVLTYLKFGMTLEFIKFTILLSTLIIVTFIDFEYSIIPGKLMILLGLCGIIIDIIGYKLNTELLTYLYGFLLGGGVILIIVLLTGGMGGGDIQLMAVIGLYLGFKYTLLTLMLSFIIGAVVGIALIVLKKKSRKDYIPFGPWISLAAMITIFWGDGIISWYISLI